MTFISTPSDFHQHLCYLSLPLDGYGAARLHGVAAQLVERGLAAGRDVNAERLAAALHARRRVHGVPEQAVARHRQPHHARHHGACTFTSPRKILIISNIIRYFFAEIQ